MNDDHHSKLSEKIQSQFTQAEDLCYLNHAAVSPWPKITEQAVTEFAHENRIYGATQYPKWMGVEQQLRQHLATLINASSCTEIALAKSTSEALSIIAYGLTWEAGDEIIISDQEFPSNRIVWESLSEYGVKLRIADISTGDPVTAFEQCINAKTKLISVSSVQYASGLQIDLLSLSKLCRRNNILFCIDAIQSLGAIPFDQTKIQADFIVADGHKWMMAAEGLALMYIKQSVQDRLKLYQFGWHMIKDKGQYDKLDWEPANDATRFECGSPNMLGIHALHASIGLILEIGVPTIHQELNKTIDYLIKKLQEIEQLTFISAIDPDTRSGIVNFTIPDIDLSTLQNKLMKRGVICAYRGGGIRFSPHFYTPENSIDRAITILKEEI